MKYETRNLKELPKFRDGLSYLYLEHGKLEQQDQSVAFWGPEGAVAIPAASLGVLLLGPGTTVSHAAMRQLANNGCSVAWVGEEMVRFYANGTGETRSSSNFLRQVQIWSHLEARLEVVRRLYRMRFPEKLPENLTMEQLRGREGVRVRETYATWSRLTGVPWSGRSYQRGQWDQANPINRALSSGAACLYGVAHAAIISAGYNPALGFIHTGKQLSFVFDIADLYKAQLLVPTAFRAVAESDQNIEQRIRHTLRDQLREEKVLERIVGDLHSLFENIDLPDPYAQDAAAPGDLWDPDGNVPGGMAYGHDNSQNEEV